MSETKSSLNALRQFRFEKSSEDAEEKNGDAEETPTIARKRVIALVDDSCSEAETSPTKFTPDCLSPNEKEQRLQSTMKIQPEYDMMDVQDALVHNKWDVSSAVKHLKNNCQKRRRIEEIKTPPSSTTNGSSSSSSTSHHRSHHHHHHHHHHHSSSSSHHSSSSPHKSSSHKSSSSSSKHSHHSHSSSSHHHKKSSSHRESARDEDSDDEDAKQMKAKVYDSDEDSDGGEVTKQMSKDRKKVFEFFNSSTLHELQSIKSCSLKKAQLLVELRPFRNWEDLVSKMRNNKGVSSEVLNQCQELLFRRHNLSTTMKKCNKLIGKLEAAVAAGTGLVSQPASLSPNLTLAEYQIVGLNWLAVMHYEGMNGILADEMGLGKTVQIIAFLTYLKEVGQAKKTHLIVVPSSTLDNWSNELERWSPSLVVERYYGSSDERKMLRCKYARGGLEGIDVLLTTYHMVSSTPEERKMFRVTNMHYVIYDEAHMLKNMTTARYVNLNRITAERRILLTGTPLQNNLLELMSLLCFVMPTLFGKNQDDMKDLFSKKIISKNDTGEEVMSFEHSQIEQAKKIMKPFVLRRLKRDVLNSLPKKTAINIPITMTKTQTEQYKNLVESYTKNGVVQSSSETAGISMMVNLRKLANHPLLLRHYYSDETVREIAFKLSRNLNYKKTNADHIFDEIAYLSDFKIYQLINKYNIQRMDLPDHLIEGSGKFGHLDELLPKLKEEGHRVLIFSQFTMMLDVLEKYLTLRSHEYVRIDGQTAVTERQDLIDQFTDDPEIFIFLLSTRAGGLGINLTAADTVILHDIDFNPYNDKQAEDRCHRMGQTKPVTIYRLITDGTIEQGMQIIAQEKLNLEKEVTADSTGENEVQEHKCMVRLLTMALGLDENKAETLLSPDKNEVKKLSRLCED